ncbi:MAG: hypothetical protein IKP07_05095 [Bacilli bacterium]|jgi:hypothetical protein|nr:hypothetical protein [Bacilli bacterium]
MKNKILIKVIVPELEESYDIFVPVNELVWKVKVLISKAISDLNGGVLNIKDNYVLINKYTSQIYGNNEKIISTDIRNATELILINLKK